MAAQDIIQQILLRRPDVGREQILERLKTEQSKTGGLIADVTLLRLIANEFGVEIPQDKVYEQKFSISHLCVGLNDATVSGRIIAVYPSRTFEGKRPGKFASVIISDKDAIIRVMLWNEKAQAVESGELKTGQIARFSHGYTKEGRNGKTELHLGDKSRIEIQADTSTFAGADSVNEQTSKVASLNEEMKSANVEGEVATQPISREVKTSEGETIKLTVFELEDDSGTVKVLAWRDHAEVAGSLKLGDRILLKNVYAKVGFEEKLELSTRSGTSITVIH